MPKPYKVRFFLDKLNGEGLERPINSLGLPIGEAHAFDASICRGKRIEMLFPIVLHTDDGQQFGVSVPDLPGCFSGGEGIEEAIQSAKEAIDFHVEGLILENQEVPLPKSLTVHKENPDYIDGIWAIVDVPVEKYLGPSKKINITVPAMLLDRIDEYVKSHGENRSGFLVKAAKKAMSA